MGHHACCGPGCTTAPPVTTQEASRTQPEQAVHRVFWWLVGHRTPYSEQLPNAIQLTRDGHCIRPQSRSSWPVEKRHNCVPKTSCDCSCYQFGQSLQSGQRRPSGSQGSLRCLISYWCQKKDSPNFPFILPRWGRGMSCLHWTEMEFRRS